MESHDEERTCYGAAADASSVTWGICGTLTEWGTKPDIKMNAQGAFFVAKNVTFTATDMFKIRGNNVWNDAFNYGASSKGYKLPLNTGYVMTLGAASQDMAVPAAGTYDIYFSLGAQKVWLMTAGSAAPAAPSVGGTGGGNTNAIGISMCGMFEFSFDWNRNEPKNVGKYPLTAVQCEATWKKIAQICKKYSIAVSPDTVMTHYEFGKKFPNTSSYGKPDIVHLPYQKNLKPNQIGDFIRNKVKWYLNNI
jgi:hypothetical protein